MGLKGVVTYKDSLAFISLLANLPSGFHYMHRSNHSTLIVEI